MNHSLTGDRHICNHIGNFPEVGKIYPATDCHVCCVALHTSSSIKMAVRVMYIVRLSVRRYSSGLLDNTNLLHSMPHKSSLFLTKHIEVLYIMPHNPYNVFFNQYVPTNRFHFSLAASKCLSRLITCIAYFSTTQVHQRFT